MYDQEVKQLEKAVQLDRQGTKTTNRKSIKFKKMQHRREIQFN